MGVVLCFCPAAVQWEDCQGCGDMMEDVGTVCPCRWALATSPVQLQNYTILLQLKHVPWLPSTHDYISFL